MSTQMAPVEIDRSRKTLPTRRMGGWLSPLQSLEDWIDEVESRWIPRGMLPSQPFRLNGYRTPRVDVIERDQEICVRAEMPGVDKENIEVNLCDDLLTIKSSVRKEQRQEEENYLHCEISQEEYHRSLGLPASALTEKAVASFHDGMLEVLIPKKPGQEVKKLKIQ